MLSTGRASNPRSGASPAPTARTGWAWLSMARIPAISATRSGSARGGLEGAQAARITAKSSGRIFMEQYLGTAWDWRIMLVAGTGVACSGPRHGTYRFLLRGNRIRTVIRPND